MGVSRVSTGVCADCGGRSVEECRQTSFVYLHDGKSVTLEAVVPVRRCEACGEESADYRAEDIKHEAVCRFLGRLAPSDIRAFREQFDLTQTRLAEITGLGVASIRRWESGNQILSLSVDRYLRLLFAEPRTFELALKIETKKSTDRVEPKFATPVSQRSRENASAFRLRMPEAA